MKRSVPTSPTIEPLPSRRRMVNSSVLRITREIADIQKGTDLSLAVAFREDDVRDVRALIIGPPDTPYEFGFFEIKLKFSDKYPIEPPKVKCITTNSGQCRFNPNIYANGKICLSILGTWRGEKGEDWSTAQGLESILISIQSLMSSNPYENEPGHEDASVNESKEAQAYASKIQHETLHITVIQRLEHLLHIQDKDKLIDEDMQPGPKKIHFPATEDDVALGPDDSPLDDDREDIQFDPFNDLYKQRFLWYYDVYAATIAKASEVVKNGKPFPTAVFEYPSNTMSGRYAYKSLSTRLARIRKALDDEQASWSIQGLQALKQDRGIATNLSRQFEQHSGHFKNSSLPIELSLVENNPFVWNLTFFGKAETDLYGATINVRMHFSLNFPQEQPRVNVLTPLFHHRISVTGGVLCYFPSKPDSIRSHIDAIMSSIEEEHPAYDPRTLVNPAAAALMWGKEDQKKVYRRKLRRSVQDSMENMDEF